MYALNLDKDNRILSVTYEQFASPGMPIVYNIPEGNVSDWLFVDGQYVNNPLPKPKRAGVNTKISPGEYFTAGSAAFFQDQDRTELVWHPYEASCHQKKGTPDLGEHAPTTA